MNHRHHHQEPRQPMNHTAPTTMPARFAAPARERPQDPAALEAAAAEAAAEQQAADPQADELIENWLAWSRQHRFIAPPAGMGNVLGRLRGATRPSREPPTVRLSSWLFAVNLAIKLEPDDALDKKVFWLHYVIKAKPVKTAADALGISPAHYYRLRRAFLDRVLIAAKKIEADNLAAGDALAHRAQHVE
jgi:hypothetical protein